MRTEHMRYFGNAAACAYDSIASGISSDGAAGVDGMVADVGALSEVQSPRAGEVMRLAADAAKEVAAALRVGVEPIDGAHEVYSREEHEVCARTKTEHFIARTYFQKRAWSSVCSLSSWA